MANRTGDGMVLTSRDIEIVRAVSACRALTGEQIRKHLKFGSVGRANATLLRLVRHRYLTRRFQPTVVGTRRPIYFIDRAGYELVDGDIRPQKQSDVSDLFLQHRLSVNDVRFAFEDWSAAPYRFGRWLSEEQLRQMNLGPLPDGYVEYAFNDAVYCAFIEVDRGTEGLIRFEGKVRAYLNLAFSGTYHRLFGNRFFRTLVLAPDPGRVHALRRQIQRSTEKVFWLATTTELLNMGPLAPYWTRPGSDARHSLTEP